MLLRGPFFRRLAQLSCYLSCLTVVPPLLAQTSQDFAPMGATWTDPRTGYYMQVTKDTIMADLPAVKIEKFWPWECFGTCSQEEEDLWKTRMQQSEFVHRSGNKIYHWVVDSFYLLYDFELLPGDTYTVYLRKGLLYPDEKIHFPVLILDTASITVDGFILRGQRLWDPEGSPAYTVSFDFRGWTYEKLGKEGYLFAYNSDTNFGYPYNRCYQDMDISFGQDSGCLISPTLDLEQSQVIRIYPNPSSGIIFFEPPLERSSYIELYSIEGMRVYRSRPGTITGRVILNGISPGTYFLQITNSAYTLHETVIIN